MSPVFALDTSCMIAAVCAWHEKHAAAAREIERRLGQGERLAISAFTASSPPQSGEDKEQDDALSNGL